MKQNILNFITSIGIAYVFIFIGMHIESDYGETKKLNYIIEHNLMPTITKLKNKLKTELNIVTERNKVLDKKITPRDVPPNHQITCILKLTNLHESMVSLILYAEMYNTNIDLHADGQYEYSKNNKSISRTINYPFKCWQMTPNKHNILQPPESNK